MNSNEYIILSSRTKEGLMEQVNARMCSKDRFDPLGGVSVGFAVEEDREHLQFFQAMVRVHE